MLARCGPAVPDRRAVLDSAAAVMISSFLMGARPTAFALEEKTGVGRAKTVVITGASSGIGQVKIPSRCIHSISVCMRMCVCACVM